MSKLKRYRIVKGSLEYRYVDVIALSKKGALAQANEKDTELYTSSRKVSETVIDITNGVRL